MYDKDNSGTIDLKEFFDALRYLGLNISWVSSRFYLFACLFCERMRKRRMRSKNKSKGSNNKNKKNSKTRTKKTARVNLIFIF